MATYTCAYCKDKHWVNLIMTNGTPKVMPCPECNKDSKVPKKHDDYALETRSILKPSGRVVTKAQFAPAENIDAKAIMEKKDKEK